MGSMGNEYCCFTQLKKRMSFLPWLQAVENEEGIFPCEWSWDQEASIFFNVLQWEIGYLR
ncbi:Pentatricopeptide repeat-containing protein [Senna tora]|uniref:Pentatricopeptide repeat-containing protein n=1 Tax=Senna tora TaxID=362788 RepID=A0A834TIL0_9FABA|nr:Pentatricopeptide repeat-containing protein [Senna tora]